MRTHGNSFRDNKACFLIARNSRDNCSDIRVHSSRRGATALSFELLLICSVLAAVILVSMMTRQVAESASEGAASRLRPIVKLVATSGGDKLIAECGLARIREVDLNSLQSNFLYNGAGRCHWHVSRDGRTLMIAGSDQTMMVTVDDEVVVDEKFSRTGNLVCDLSHDGKLAVVIEQGASAHCWDLASGQHVTFKLQTVAERVVVDSRHRRIIVKTRTEIDFYDLDAHVRPISFATTTEGNLVLSDDSRWLLAYGGHSATVYDVESCKAVWTCPFDDAKRTVVVDISADSRMVVIGRPCRQLSVKAIESGNTLFECNMDENLCSIAFAADGRSVLIGQSDGSLVRQPLIPGAPAEPVRLGVASP